MSSYREGSFDIAQSFVYSQLTIKKGRGMKISDLLSKNARTPYVNQTDASNQPEKTPPSQEAKEELPDEAIGWIFRPNPRRCRKSMMCSR